MTKKPTRRDPLEDIAQALKSLTPMAENVRSDHPLQAQTFEQIQAGLGEIADAIEAAGEQIAAAIRSLKPPGAEP